MSADNYPCIFSREMETIVYIFSRQMETIVFTILQIFFATRAVLKLGKNINNILHLARKYARIFDVVIA